MVNWRRENILLLGILAVSIVTTATGKVLETRYKELASRHLRIDRHGLEVPDEVDWRTKGYVTPVKNQGQCGDPSIFAALGAMEGQLKRKSGQLETLSEQQLIDCCKAEPAECCSGSFEPESYFQCVLNTKGIDTEKCYPTDGQCGPCRFNASCSVLQIKGFVDLPSGDEESLKIAVATIGPVAVSVDASSEAFQLYVGGVYIDEACSSTLLDHSMLIVGYGTLDSQDYWIVKNSWGPDWGMKGYILMARNRNNQCGIASSATYPLL